MQTTCLIHTPIHVDDSTRGDNRDLVVAMPIGLKENLDGISIPEGWIFILLRGNSEGLSWIFFTSNPEVEHAIAPLHHESRRETRRFSSFDFPELPLFLGTIFNCIVGNSPFLSDRSIGGSAAFKCAVTKKSSIDIIAGFF